MDFYITSINVPLTYKIIDLGPKRPCSGFAYKQHTRKSAKSHFCDMTPASKKFWLIIFFCLQEGVKNLYKTLPCFFDAEFFDHGFSAVFS